VSSDIPPDTVDRSQPTVIVGTLKD